MLCPFCVYVVDVVFLEVWYMVCVESGKFVCRLRTWERKAD